MRNCSLTLRAVVDCDVCKVAVGRTAGDFTLIGTKQSPDLSTDAGPDRGIGYLVVLFAISSSMIWYRMRALSCRSSIGAPSFKPW